MHNFFYHSASQMAHRGADSCRQPHLHSIYHLARNPTTQRLIAQRLPRPKQIKSPKSSPNGGLAGQRSSLGHWHNNAATGHSVGIAIPIGATTTHGPAARLIVERARRAGNIRSFAHRKLPALRLPSLRLFHQRCRPSASTDGSYLPRLFFSTHVSQQAYEEKRKGAYAYRTNAWRGNDGQGENEKPRGG